jgi:hypothetical protein
MLVSVLSFEELQATGLFGVLSDMRRNAELPSLQDVLVRTCVMIRSVSDERELGQLLEGLSHAQSLCFSSMHRELRIVETYGRRPLQVPVSGAGYRLAQGLAV